MKLTVEWLREHKQQFEEEMTDEFFNSFCDMFNGTDEKDYIPLMIGFRMLGNNQVKGEKYENMLKASKKIAPKLHSLGDFMQKHGVSLDSPEFKQLSEELSSERKIIPPLSIVHLKENVELFERPLSDEKVKELMEMYQSSETSWYAKYFFMRMVSIANKDKFQAVFDDLEKFKAKEPFSYLDIAKSIGNISLHFVQYP